MVRYALLVLLLAASSQAQRVSVDEAHIRADMEFLASDAMQGRGSGTEFEHVAAVFIGSQLRQYGIQPLGDELPAANGKRAQRDYVQTVRLERTTFSAPPTLTAGELHWTHGKEIAVSRAASAQVVGKLVRFTPGTTTTLPADSAALVRLTETAGSPSVREQLTAPIRAGAKMVLIADAAQIRQRFKASAAESPEIASGIAPRTYVYLNEDATRQIEALPDGALVSLTGESKVSPAGTTWNAIGVLPGKDPKAGAILLSAHLDHLGVKPELEGDQIFNGADDDASGVTAVLELARTLAAGKPLKRTVYFALYGSEEKGGLGSGYFVNHLPFPLESLLTNIEFEMIGRADPAIAADALWMAGFDRSDLGATLARHGAHLVNDPHPEQDFFQRSDNFMLARKGVVAVSISSFGLHKQYHQPDDDLAHIDFSHMLSAIKSMQLPVLWLADSTFTPHWLPGKRP